MARVCSVQQLEQHSQALERPEVLASAVGLIGRQSRALHDQRGSWNWNRHLQNRFISIHPFGDDFIDSLLPFKYVS
jgi:hypothetical protein